jgi:hypothetical protein
VDGHHNQKYVGIAEYILEQSTKLIVYSKVYSH